MNPCPMHADIYSAVWEPWGGGGVTMRSSDPLRGISGPKVVEVKNFYSSKMGWTFEMQLKSKIHWSLNCHHCMLFTCVLAAYISCHHSGIHSLRFRSCNFLVAMSGYVVVNFRGNTSYWNDWENSVYDPSQVKTLASTTHGSSSKAASSSPSKSSSVL